MSLLIPDDRPVYAFQQIDADGNIIGSSMGGSGDVVGPGSSVADNVVAFNGTTGKLMKDSLILSTNLLTTINSKTVTSKTFDNASNSFSDANTYTHDLTVTPNQTGGWTEYFVTGSDATTTNLTATDITGLVSGTLSNSTKYEILAVLQMLNGADTNGVKIAIHGGGTGTAASCFVVATENSNTASAANSQAISAIDTLSNAFLLYSAGEGICQLRGFVTTRSTGTATISIQFAKVTANTATCRVGSIFRIKKAHT